MSNLPDYVLKVYNKNTHQRGIIGAAWVDTEKTSITLKITPMVVIESSADWLFKLFPVTPANKAAVEELSNEKQDDPQF